MDPTFRGHYHSGEKHPPDIDRVLSRAFENGISKIIITGMSLESSHAAIDMARSDGKIYTYTYTKIIMSCSITKEFFQFRSYYR